MSTGARSRSVQVCAVAVQCSCSTGAFGSSSAEVNGGGKLLVMAPLSEALGHTYLWAPPVNCFLIKIGLSRVPGPLY